MRKPGARVLRWLARGLTTCAALGTPVITVPTAAQGDLALFAMAPVFTAGHPAPSRKSDCGVEAWIEELQASDSAPGAVVGLRECGAAAVSALIKVLQTKTSPEEWKIRASAALALGAIGPAAKDAVPALAPLLRDEAMGTETRTQIRGWAAKALVSIGPASIPVLVSALSDSDKEVRINAAYALGSVGRPAIAATARAAKDPAPGVRQAAVFALGRTSHSDAVASLVEALADNDLTVRLFAVDALGRLGTHATGAVPRLARYLSDADLGTKVHEALVTITGEDHGMDAARWRPMPR